MFARTFRYEADETFGCGLGMGVEVLREISMLQLLNGAHPNVMHMVDVRCRFPSFPPIL